MTTEEIDHAYAQKLPAWRIKRGAAGLDFGATDPAGKVDMS